MVHPDDYFSLGGGMKIRFDAPGLDLRDVSLIAGQIHRIVNKVARREFGIPTHYPELYAPGLPFGLPRDPLLVSLELTGLTYGSFSAETKIRIHRVARDLSIGAAGSLIASVIWTIAESNSKKVQVEEQPSRPNVEAAVPKERYLDIGVNIRDIANGMAASGKQWELLVEDTETGQRVIIRSSR
jgi:hypothetical protein